MATRLQLRRGTEAENNAYTGAVGEITIDTTNEVIRIHDGVTPGGVATVMANSTQTLTTGNLLPAANVTYNIGSPTQRWNTLYLAANTIDLGQVQLKATDSTTFSVFQSDGVTLGNINAASVNVSAISSGTTSFGIPTASGNAVITVGGTSNVLEIATNRASLGGALVATGNITGSYILGNGSQLTGIDATSIQNGTANVKTILNGNVTISAAGTPNVVVITSTGANIAGTLNATGNANVGNLGATNIVGTLTTAAQTNITSVGTLGSLSVTGNISGDNVSGTLLTGTLVTAAQPNVTSLGTLVSLNVTGNANVGNLGTNGNITASYLFGNGSQLSGIDASGIQNGTSNVRVTSSGGNVTTSVGGTANVLVVTATGANVTGTINATGNANVGNIGATNAVLAGALSGVTTINASGNANVGNIGATNIVGTLETASQTNITSVGTLGTLNVTGNANVGNLGTNGNITANYLFGNGSQLSGIDASGIQNGTSNVKVVSSGGNVTTSVGGTADVLVVTATGANVTGTFNATGNANVGNIGATNIVGTLTTAAQTNITSVGTLTSLSVTGNISGGNVSGTLLTGTLATAAQSNVTSLGTLTSLTITGNVNQTGNLNITGNINATGNLNYQNVTDLVIGDPLIFLGANNTANLVDLGFIATYDDGLDQHGGFVRNHLNGVWGVFGNVVTEPTTVVDWGNAIYQPLRAGAATFASANINGALTGATSGVFSGNVSTGNVSGATGTFTNVSGTLTTAAQTNITSVGTLGSLTVTGNIAGGNVSGTLLTGTLTTAAQPNITSVGTLTSLTVTGNVSGGNLNVTGNIVDTGALSIITAASGNITLAPDGTNMLVATTTGANIAGTLNATGNANVGNLGATNIVGILTTAAQTNITSVGTLTSLAVTGNITSGNLSGTNIVGTLTTAAQTNITSVGTLTSLAVTGNITSGNISATTGTFTNIGGTITTAAQTNITSVGTLGSLTVTGNISSGNLNVTGNIVDTGALSIITAASGNITLAPNGTNMLVATTTGANIAGTLNTTGNSTAGNYTTAGQVTATGNITTSAYFKGDGSQLTNIAVSAGNALTNGNSNVFVTANANITFGASGVANVVTISSGALALGGGAVFSNPKSSSGSGTLPTGVNAMLIGPYVVSNGDTITAPSGSTLIVI